MATCTAPIDLALKTIYSCTRITYGPVDLIVRAVIPTMMLLALATSLARAAASSSAAAAAPSAPWLGAGWLVSLPEEELQLQQADRGQYSL